jgi:integrase
MRKNITIRLVKSLKPADKPYEVTDTDITGFLVRVQPTGRMTYYLSYRLAGKSKSRYKIGVQGTISATQARDVAKVQAGKVAQGIDIQADKKAKREAKREAVRLKPARTLKGFLDTKYEPWVTTERKTGAATVARIRHNFADLLDKPLADINTWLLDKWRAKQTRKKKMTATINRDIVALKAALAKAVKWGIIDVNPLAGYALKKVDNLPKPKYLSAKEEKALRKALLAREVRMRTGRAQANEWRRKRGYHELSELDSVEFADRLRPVVLVALNTGMRRGELFHLAWQNVDFRTKTITVDGKTAKSDRTRHVPMNAEVFNTLKAWKAQTKGNLVFPGRDSKPLDNIRRSWKGVLEDAKIRNFRFHDLRHSFASNLVMAGVDLNTVRELLGHADIKMTLRYAHLASEHKADAVAQL